MSALRQSVRRRRFWIYCVVAAALAVVAVSDWLRPAQAQTSVVYYNRAVETLYRGHIHQYTSRYVRCRFIPSCSGYSIMAMQVYGFPKGLWLTVKRICRCTPWVRDGTVDLLPTPTPPQLQQTAVPQRDPLPKNLPEGSAAMNFAQPRSRRFPN